MTHYTSLPLILDLSLRKQWTEVVNCGGLLHKTLSLQYKCSHLLDCKFLILENLTKVQSMFHYIHMAFFINIFPLTISYIFPLLLSISSHLKQIPISTCKPPKEVHRVSILKVEDSYIIKLIRMWFKQFTFTMLKINNILKASKEDVIFFLLIFHLSKSPMDKREYSFRKYPGLSYLIN